MKTTLPSASVVKPSPTLLSEYGISADAAEHSSHSAAPTPATRRSIPLRSTRQIAIAVVVCPSQTGACRKSSPLGATLISRAVTHVAVAETPSTGYGAGPQPLSFPATVVI